MEVATIQAMAVVVSMTASYRLTLRPVLVANRLVGINSKGM